MPGTVSSVAPHTPDVAVAEVVAASKIAIEEINKFTEKVFKTRGGRMGSGMGSLLEALWAYYIDQGRPAKIVENDWWEIAWLPDHEYNDFACVAIDKPWESSTKTGEFFRIEAKSMNSGAVESKGHFDQLADTLGPLDLLLVLVWSWEPSDRNRVYPKITDQFLARAEPIARLRDALHIARGGSFVDRKKCPDGCPPATCKHHGEPLNASDKRERASGPVASKPANVPFAANFGGLVRMLKTSGGDARATFMEWRRKHDEAHQFISFIHKYYPDEEVNTYPIAAWREVAEEFDLETSGSKEDLVSRVRAVPGYMEQLRLLE